MCHLVSHDHRHLMVGELELVENPCVKGNLAARHAKALIWSLFKTITSTAIGRHPVPRLRVWLEIGGNLLKASHLRVIRRQEGFFWPPVLEGLDCRAADCSSWRAGTSLRISEPSPTTTPSPGPASVGECVAQADRVSARSPDKTIGKNRRPVISRTIPQAMVRSRHPHSRSRSVR